jgi:hypothetical protein
MLGISLHAVSNWIGNILSGGLLHGKGRDRKGLKVKGLDKARVKIYFTPILAPRLLIHLIEKFAPPWTKEVLLCAPR